MQAVVAPLTVAALPRRAAKPARAARAAVVCRASMEKGPLAAVAAAASMLVAHPAFALVDERMNGEGAGLPLGVNNAGLVVNLAIIFTGVWAAYASSAKDLGGGDNDDSGLSL